MKSLWKDKFYYTSEVREVFVKGILIPTQWERDGTIKKFAIYSDEEEDIIIEEFRSLNKLKRLVNRRVLAKGRLRIDEDGKYIKIKSIKEISGPTSPATQLSITKPFEVFFDEYALSIPKEYTFKHGIQFMNSS